MIFRKLLIENCPGLKGKPHEKWYMILRTAQDVLQYMDMDIELMTTALMALPNSITKSHLEGARERVLNVAIQSAVNRAGTDEKVYPIVVLANLCDGKAKTMLNMIARGEEVLVQQMGGYCTYAGYASTWNAKVLEEVEQPGCFYPTDNVPISSDLLFLENGERVPVEFERKILKTVFNNDYNSYQSFNSNYVGSMEREVDPKKKVLYKMTMLKMRDPKYVFAMVSKAKVIALETQVADTKQLDNFMKMFTQVERKTVYISTSCPEDIKQHPLYTELSFKHEIIFI